MKQKISFQLAEEYIYDDLESEVDNEKFWWVSKEDENYSKMNKFLEDLYKESIVYVNELPLNEFVWTLFLVIFFRRSTIHHK